MVNKKKNHFISRQQINSGIPLDTYPINYIFGAVTKFIIRLS